MNDDIYNTLKQRLSKTYSVFVISSYNWHLILKRPRWRRPCRLRWFLGRSGCCTFLTFLHLFHLFYWFNGSVDNNTSRRSRQRICIFCLVCYLLGYFYSALLCYAVDVFPVMCKSYQCDDTYSPRFRFSPTFVNFTRSCVRSCATPRAIFSSFSLGVSPVFQGSLPLASISNR